MGRFGPSFFLICIWQSGLIRQCPLDQDVHKVTSVFVQTARLKCGGDGPGMPFSGDLGRSHPCLTELPLPFQRHHGLMAFNRAVCFCFDMGGFAIAEFRCMASAGPQLQI